MATGCINCCETFSRSSKKRFERYSLQKQIPNHNLTVKDALGDFLCLSDPFTPQTKRHDDRCVCLTCYNLLVKITRGRSLLAEASAEFRARTKPTGYLSGKQTPMSPPPVTQKRKLSDRTPTRSPCPSKKLNIGAAAENPALTGRKGFKKRIIRHVMNGNYGTCFRILMSKSNKAFNQFMQQLGKMIQKEVKEYKKQASLMARPLSLDNLTTVSWPNLLSEVEDSLPIIWNCLSNLLAPKKKAKDLDINPETLGKHVPVLGMMISAALFARYPHLFKMLPCLVSTMLFKHGNHHAVCTIIVFH